MALLDKFRWLVPMILSAAFAAFLAVYLLTPKPLTLQIYFDGGYTFDFTRGDAVNVYEMKKAGYPMKAELMSNTGSPTIDVTGYTLRILPDGSAPARKKPDLPPDTPSQTGC